MTVTAQALARARSAAELAEQELRANAAGLAERIGYLIVQLDADDEIVRVLHDQVQPASLVSGDARSLERRLAVALLRCRAALGEAARQAARAERLAVELHQLRGAVPCRCGAHVCRGEVDGRWR
jgi:hypothetical protein